MSRAGSLGLARRPEKRRTELPPGQGTEPSEPRGGRQRARARGKATRRAGLPGRRGTRRDPGSGGPRHPGRDRGPASRGRGEAGAAAPGGALVTPRGRLDRTRPAAPPSCPFPPTRAARYPAAAALTSGCTSARRRLSCCLRLRSRRRRRLAAEAESRGSRRVPPPPPLPPPPEQNTPKWRHFRRLPPAGRADAEGEGGSGERTTAVPPAAPSRAGPGAGAGRAPGAAAPPRAGEWRRSRAGARGPRVPARASLFVSLLRWREDAGKTPGLKTWKFSALRPSPARVPDELAGRRPLLGAEYAHNKILAE